MTRTTRATMSKLRLRAVAVAALVATASACAPPPPPGFSHSYMTRDKADIYNYSGDSAAMSVSAPGTNFGSNSRVFFWRDDAPVTTNSSSCATFSDTGSPIQEGVVLRVRNDAGRIRAVSVTKNVWMYINTTFNVHVWDSANTAEPFTQVGAVDMAPVLGTPAASYPWRLCAEAVGAQVLIKVWAVGTPEPAQAKAVNLPPGWTFEGRPGTYIGHLPPGGSAQFTDLVTAAR